LFISEVKGTVILCIKHLKYNLNGTIHFPNPGFFLPSEFLFWHSNDCHLLKGSFQRGSRTKVIRIVLGIFGGKKIPELMQSIGKGVKSFKDGMEGMEDEIKSSHNPDPAKEPEKDKPTEKIGS